MPTAMWQTLQDGRIAGRTAVGGTGRQTHLMCHCLTVLGQQARQRAGRSRWRDGCRQRHTRTHRNKKTDPAGPHDSWQDCSYWRDNADTDTCMCHRHRTVTCKPASKDRTAQCAGAAWTAAQDRQQGTATAHAACERPALTAAVSSRRLLWAVLPQRLLLRVTAEAGRQQCAQSPVGWRSQHGMLARRHQDQYLLIHRSGPSSWALSSLQMVRPSRRTACNHQSDGNAWRCIAQTVQCTVICLCMSDQLLSEVAGVCCADCRVLHPWVQYASASCPKRTWKL